MKTSIKIAFVFSFLLLIISCTKKTLVPNDLQEIHFVTVDEIKKSLGKKTIVAGFDIDDTVLFSSPGFYYGLQNHDGYGGKNIYGNDPLQSKKFWSDMNGVFDKFSLPKKAGRDLVQMHHARGDKVVFITARNSSKISIVSKILSQGLDIPEPKVIFTSDESKAAFIRNQGVSIYYGDADSDVTQAKEAKARPVRVMRSPLSTNNASPINIGKFGEEVLINSEN